MDWSKAKNILILAFIVTNVFLIYNIQSKLFEQEQVQLINDESVANVEQYLEESKIKLETNIPREIISLPILDVRYKIFNSDSIAESLLGKDYIKETRSTEYLTLNKEIFKTEDKELTIDGNKRLKYINKNNDVNNYLINEEKIIEISDNFLKEHNLLTENIKLDQIYYGVEDKFESKQLYKLIYNQTYDDKFLGHSYMYVYVNHQGVVGLEAMFLEHEKTNENKRQVIPATEALMRAMNSISLENDLPIIIKDVELGYYFNPESYMSSDWKSIESGTAFPSWKITIENGKTYFIEAYKN